MLHEVGRHCALVTQNGSLRSRMHQEQRPSEIYEPSRILHFVGVAKPIWNSISFPGLSADRLVAGNHASFTDNDHPEVGQIVFENAQKCQIVPVSRVESRGRTFERSLHHLVETPLHSQRAELEESDRYLSMSRRGRGVLDILDRPPRTDGSTSGAAAPKLLLDSLQTHCTPGKRFRRSGTFDTLPTASNLGFSQGTGDKKIITAATAFTSLF